jgi:hypothetical protein
MGNAVSCCHFDELLPGGLLADNVFEKHEAKVSKVRIKNIAMRIAPVKNKSKRWFEKIIHRFDLIILLKKIYFTITNLPV